MKTYLIQRNLPNAGQLTMEEKTAIATRSCGVIEDLGHDKLQWIHSYITPNNLWCVYKAINEQILEEHAKRGAFPCDNILEIQGMLTPAMAAVEMESNISSN